MKSTMTRERAIEIARQAAAHEPTRPSYYAEPFEPHEWVIGAIMNAAHLAVIERFDGSQLGELLDAWIDLPSPGIIPNGFGEPIQRLINAVSVFVNRDELLKDPEVQRRTMVATAKCNLMWLAEQIRLARAYGLTEQLEDLQKRLANARETARSLGILVLEDSSLGVN